MIRSESKTPLRRSSPSSIARARLPIIVVTALAFLATSSLWAGPPYTTEIMTIDLPDVTLIDQDAREVSLRELVDSGEVVLVDFIFGTCTTICPILSAGFSNLQRRLGSGPGGPVLISFSIDPEHDGPEIMKKYLKRYRAQPGWSFLTGDRNDIDRIMRAFDAYVPDKMSHQPVSFIRIGASDRWLKIDGLVSTADLLAELAKARENGSDAVKVQK